MTTPTRQALTEAAGLEAARVYGATCPEWHPPTPSTAHPQPYVDNDRHRPPPRRLIRGTGHDAA